MFTNFFVLLFGIAPQLLQALEQCPTKDSLSSAKFIIIHLISIFLCFFLILIHLISPNILDI